MRASDNMWFYNPSGVEFTGITGIPICVEAEFQNGTEGSMDGCPAGYSVITDEYTCRTAAECQDLCTFQQFRTLDPNEEDTNPKGCHRAADGCVQFNNKTSDPTCSLTGTACVGFPLCNVTTPYTGSSSGVHTATQAGAAALTSTTAAAN